MRILHVIRSLHPEYGGPAQLVRSIVAAGPRIGWEGEVACLDRSGEPFLSEIPFPVYALGEGLGVYGYSTRWEPWLRENIDRFDGVVIHGIWQYQSWGTWRAIRHRKPYVLFPHGMLDPWFKRRYPLKHMKKWIYWQLAERRVLRDASSILFTCETERRLAPESFRMPAWNAAVVPYGSERPKGDIGPQIEAFYQMCPAARERRILLYLGRIHPKKGCDLLIEAFGSVAGAFPEVDLVMAGPDAGMRARLEASVAAAGLSQRVHWPGLLTGDAKWGAFHASEVFVLPSHQENFGIAVAEALACKRPVLISDQVNIWPEIQSDGAGLVAPDTLEGTELLLKRWLALDETGRSEMQQRARACFDNRYDLDQNVSELVGFFQRMQPTGSQEDAGKRP
jgi:glycosyltransferase involved in cell wall biosynthesis